jgi:hypothetical protein
MNVQVYPVFLTGIPYHKLYHMHLCCRLGDPIMNKILDDNYYDLIISNVMIPYYVTGDNITHMNIRNSLAHVPNNPVEPCDLGTYPYNA